MALTTFTPHDETFRVHEELREESASVCVTFFRKPQGGADPGPEGGAVSWQRVTLILELLQHKKKLKRAQMLVPVLFSLLAR